jgi:23S rRNA (uracil1939-C5)-methyltransferase
LLSAGHRVASVELDPESIADARATRERWTDRERWEVESASIADFLHADQRDFDVVVVDPPRAGLGTGLAAELASRSRALFLYISCDPATLARDLPAIRASGFEIRGTQLYDLFAFTHRIEALVALERVA